MKNIVEQIHREFRTSLANKLDDIDKLESELISEVKALGQPMDTSLISSIRKLGFEQSATVALVDHNNQSRKKLINFEREVKDTINWLHSMRQHGYSIITYSQIVDICDKYNLFIAPSTLFKGEIPEANMKEIVMYNSIAVNNHTGIKFSSVLEKKTRHTALFESEQYFSDRPTYYMVAPKTDFNITDGYVNIGREIFYNKKLAQSVKFKLEKMPTPPDPIVIVPLWSPTDLGRKLKFFHVVTAWGPEAWQPSVARPLSN